MFLAGMRDKIQSAQEVQGLDVALEFIEGVFLVDAQETAKEPNAQETLVAHTGSHHLV